MGTLSVKSDTTVETTSGSNGKSTRTFLGECWHTPPTSGALVHMKNDIEKCRVQVTLASGIPEEVCKTINLGYRDPRTIVPSDFANREEEGVLLVPKAGEMLYHLNNRPEWAREM